MCDSRCNSRSATSSRSLELSRDRVVHLDQIQQVGHRFQRIVDLMRDAGGQPSRGRQLFRAPQRLFRSARFGGFPHVDDQPSPGCGYSWKWNQCSESSLRKYCSNSTGTRSSMA